MRKMTTETMRTALTILAIIVFLTTPALARKGFNGERGGRGPGSTSPQIEFGEATDAEIVSLRYMREEEKMSRDLYRAFSEQWGLVVFSRIADSESRHMAAIDRLLTGFGIDTTDLSDEEGVFVDAELSMTYSELLSKGMETETDALLAAAQVEDMDIFDLRQELVSLESDMIRQVYERLARGSEHHLRAFSNQLAASGLTYEALYLSPEELEEILSGKYPSGNGPRSGNGDCDGTGFRNMPEDCVGSGIGLLTRGGNGGGNGGGRGGNGGNGGRGAGDGTGNPTPPRDGSGNGSRTGDCVNS